MTEGVLVLMGVIVGSIGSFIVTAYKQNKEEEKEERQFKRKKLEEVHTYLTKLFEDEKRLLYDTYEFDYENTSIEMIENNPHFESHEQLKLLIDLYHQELRGNFKNLSSIIESIRDNRNKYIRARLNLQILEFETVHTTDPKYFLENYNKKMDELEEAVNTIQDHISNISSNL